MNQFATGAFAQSTVVPIANEPAPTLIVEPPLPGPLAQGLVIIPYRVENLRIPAGHFRNPRSLLNRPSRIFARRAAQWECAAAARTTRAASRQ
jgi:hypothetical protein